MFWLLSMVSTLGKNLSKTYQKPINSYFKTYQKPINSYFKTYQNLSKTYQFLFQNHSKTALKSFKTVYLLLLLL